VSELESIVLCVSPHAQADVPGSRINVGVMNLGSAGIPQLKRLLDRLVADFELDMPQANNG
jgi:hypothetical protein